MLLHVYGFKFIYVPMDSLIGGESFSQAPDSPLKAAKKRALDVGSDRRACRATI